MRGIDAFVEMLSAAGVRYLFGNPGTTELPLYDKLAADSRFAMILGLQEVPVMAMADGYAMASGKLGVVNLHISCGLGQRDGHALQRLSRRDAAAGHGRPAGSPAEVRRADPVGRHAAASPGPGPNGPSKSSASKICPRPCAAQCRWR